MVTFYTVPDMTTLFDTVTWLPLVGEIQDQGKVGEF